MNVSSPGCPPKTETLPSGMGIPTSMRALRIHALGPLRPGDTPLSLDSVPVPRPGEGEVLLRVRACGVCHTELDEIEGRTPPPRLPITPGHQVAGEVVAEGDHCELGLTGRHVGVAWLFSSCGRCHYCRSGLENLCGEFKGSGRDHDGGYADYMVVPELNAHPVPDGLSAVQAAPLLCAGAVGLRAIRLASLNDGEVVGLTGFGASGHLVLQMLQHLYPKSPVMVFARNPVERDFARQLGADWSGDTHEAPPRACHAIIDTTPAWGPVLAALEALAPAGRLVINAIAKEAGDVDCLREIDYQRHLWREKQVRTVTNVTRADVRECLALAAVIPLQPEVTVLPLEQANQALQALRFGAQRGAKVLVTA